MHQTVVGSREIGTGDQAHGPGLATGRQHLGQCPVASLADTVAGPQLDERRIASQYHLGLRRDQRTTCQGQLSIEQQDIGSAGPLAQDARQGHARRPGHRLHAGRCRQQGTGTQPAADLQRHPVAQQAARGVQQGAGGIVDVRYQHAAGGGV